MLPFVKSHSVTLCFLTLHDAALRYFPLRYHVFLYLPFATNPYRTVTAIVTANGAVTVDVAVIITVTVTVSMP